jgi:hypothetical protein
MDAARLLALLGDAGGAAAPPPAALSPEDVVAAVRGAAGGAASLASSDDFPLPGFVVKTVDEGGRKVFINVCASPRVPRPPGWPPAGTGAPPEALAYLAPGGDAALAPGARAQAEAQLALPLHAGAPRGVADAGGAAAAALDVAAHPAALDAAEASRPLKLFLVDLALRAAEARLGAALDPRYKLPRARYYGAPAPLDVDGGAAAALLGGGGAAAAPPEVLREEEASAVQLEHSVRFIGRPAEAAELRVALPPAAARAAAAALRRGGAGGVRIAARGDVVTVTAPGCAPLEVLLPLAVGAAAAAELDVASGELRVRLPLAAFDPARWEPVAAA